MLVKSISIGIPIVSDSRPSPYQLSSDRSDDDGTVDLADSNSRYSYHHRRRFSSSSRLPCLTKESDYQHCVKVRIEPGRRTRKFQNLLLVEIGEMPPTFSDRRHRARRMSFDAEDGKKERRIRLHSFVDLIDADLFAFIPRSLRDGAYSRPLPIQSSQQSTAHQSLSHLVFQCRL